MKQKFHNCGILFFLVFLLTCLSQTSARSLTTKQGNLHSVNGFTTTVPVELPTASALDDLMGVEKCRNGDEECLKRRMITEAHLDYIYTQHQKP